MTARHRLLRRQRKKRALGAGAVLRQAEALRRAAELAVAEPVAGPGRAVLVDVAVLVAVVAPVDLAAVVDVAVLVAQAAVRLDLAAGLVEEEWDHEKG